MAPSSAAAFAVAALAALVALLLGVGPASETDVAGPVGACPDLLPPGTAGRDDPSPPSVVSVETPNLGRIDAEPCRSYSETYWEARDRFLTAATAAGAELTSLEVVRGGKDSPSYTMDVAVLRGSGDEKSGLVVHSSGVHGVEGYSGSAVQVAFLRHAASNPESIRRGGDGASSPGPFPTIVLVHAVNPYGMAHYRRFNENNVDLNRNALPERRWSEVKARDPNVAGYDDFDGLFNPPRPPTPWDATASFLLRAVLNIARHGFLNLKRALVAGQYHNPRGVFYGGDGLEASHRLLWDYLAESGLTDGAGGRVTWIDVHTGLGPSGVDTLMTHGADVDDVSLHFPGAPIPPQDMLSGRGGGASSGYDLSVGTMDELYVPLFPGRDALGITQEFGTKPGVMVARAMVLENAAYHHCRTGTERARYAELTRDAFYVRTDRWREGILRRGLTVLAQAVERSSRSPSKSQSN